MTATPKIDAHTDLAYQRWQAQSGWSKQDFWDQLSAQERVAVFVSNLAGQVNNGGFLQWHDNDYATPETLGFMMRLCKRLDTEATGCVFELLLQFEQAQAQYAIASHGGRGMWDEDEQFADACNKLDNTFYDIDDDFLADVEASL